VKIVRSLVKIAVLLVS